MKILSNIKRDIIKVEELQFEILESGDIFRIGYKDQQINLLRGNYIDGQAANIYIRYEKNGNQYVKPLLGLKAKSSFKVIENQIIYQGMIENTKYQVTLTIEKDRWYYDVLFDGSNDFTSYELFYGQDVGLASIWSVLSSESYTAQYTDHKAYQDENGFVIQSRQNQGVPQFLQLGSLNKTIGYATDGFQIFQTKFKVSNELEGLKQNLPNVNYQYEFPYLTLQSEKITSEKVSYFTFYGYYEPVREAILREKLNIIHNHEVCLNFMDSLGFKNFNPLSIELLETYDFDQKELKKLYKNKRHVELDDKKHILSFFTDDHVHVATKLKETLLERPHGHLLISGDILSGTERVFATTNWMFGVFQSHIVLGNTNIQKLNNDLRNPLNYRRISGLRIYLKDQNKLKLLAVPSLYEMGVNYAKWVYKLKDDTLTVRSFVKKDAFGTRLEVKSEKGLKYDFVLTNQLTLGDNEYIRDIEGIVEGNKVLFKADNNDFVKSKYPELKYRYQSHEDVTIGDESLIFDQSYQQGLLVMSYKDKNAFTLDLTASFDDLKDIDFNFEEDHKAYIKFIHSLTGLELKQKKNQDDLDKLTDTVFWYTHNALVHFASPHGLEQSNGAAWGTRDVLQGPVELFFVAQRFDLIKMILLKVFSRQFIENNDFPQWFMYDKYYNIQAHESHGDIIVWPLKALGDYIYQTGDLDILKEKVPFMSMHKGEWVEHESTLALHVNKTLNAIQNSFIEGTSLPAYGGGDWDDTLQPANKKLTDHMVSGWTPVLLFQALDTLSKVLDGSPLGRRCGDLKERIKKDYEKIMIKDNVPAGFVVFEKEKNEVEYLLHPEDKNTGLKYRLLPLTRSIISGLVDPEQAEGHVEIIDNHLKHPDGVRLMNTAVTYRGGEKTYFQRAETAANFGREIGILYVHAHIRYIEAMAKLGSPYKAYQGLFEVSPIEIRKTVKNARIRQANMYFSSSDAAFNTRYEAKEQFEKVRNGSIDVKGGWRLYSSGPGIYINQFVSNILGIRFKEGSLILDPVLPDFLKGLKVTFHYNDKKLTINYGDTLIDKVRVVLNKKDISHAVLRLDDNRYRKGGMLISKQLLEKENSDIEISLV